MTSLLTTDGFFGVAHRLGAAFPTAVAPAAGATAPSYRPSTVRAAGASGRKRLAMDHIDTWPLGPRWMESG